MPLLNSFTALDFETFTPARSSACAIGLVKVIDGHIVKKFHSLLNPIQDDYRKNNANINGITTEMVAVAPKFIELWPFIKNFIGGDVLVCHNAAFDKAVWQEQILRYRCSDDPLKYKFLCTYEITGLSLEKACAKHNIEIGCHHDALDDAVACAKIMLAENGHIQSTRFSGELHEIMKTAMERRYDHETLKPLEDSMIENKETPFFHAKTVITGIFTAYPNRDDLGKMLKSLGADINTSISKKTDIVVIGNGAGPSKIKKIEDLRTEGFDIRVIYEPELISILS